MDADTITDLAKSIVTAATAAGKIKVPSGLIRVAAIQSMLVNTNGVETENRNTMIYAHFTSMTEGERPGEGIRSFFSRIWPGSIPPDSANIWAKARSIR